MFNFMGYDYETSSLVLANSARLSLFGLKIKVTPASEADRPSGVSQAAYIKSALASPDNTPCAATFDFMIEYPMPQPVVSFIVMPDSSLEYNGFSVYCIQAKAVQQYIIKGLEPHDKNKCQTFESVSPPTKIAEPQPKIARTNSKNNTTKSSNSPSIKDNDVVDSAIIFKSDVNAGAAAEGQEGKEPEKPIKLHGAVINGAIAKLKERKRNSPNDNQGGGDGADKKESPKMLTSGRVGRKTSQDMSLTTPPSDARKGVSTPVALGEAKGSNDTKNVGRNNNARNQSNRIQDITDSASPAQEQGGMSLTSSDHISITVGDLQTMLLAMEDKIASRFEKKLSAELELQYRKMDQDQIARQEAVLKLVSQTLAKNTEQLLVQTVNKEIQNNVIPSLNKVIGAAVERQIARTMGDATAKVIAHQIVICIY
jgi:hypothetical protein